MYAEYFYQYFQYLTNCYWDSRQIYKFDAVGDEDDLIRFWGQKVKGQGHSKTSHGQMGILKVKVMHLNFTAIDNISSEVMPVDHLALKIVFKFCLPRDVVLQNC